jgi:hypothetical protein
MVINLSLSIVPEVYIPGEIIFLEGTVCDRLFVVERGVVYSKGRYYGRPRPLEKPSADYKPRELPSVRSLEASPPQPAATLGPTARWLGIEDMHSDQGLHKHFAVALTNTVMFTISRNDFEKCGINLPGPMMNARCR